MIFIFFFSGPRVPLSQMNGGNKRPNSIHRMGSTDKPYCAQHDDLIKFIFESWEKVAKDSHTYYRELEPIPDLKDFEPFDLEAWWGQRIQNVGPTQHS